MLWSWRNRPRVDEQPIHLKLSGVPGVFKSYDMHVVGVTHRNRFWRSRQSIIAKLRPLERLSLEREPTNKFDPYAVRVVSQHGQIGYLEKRDAYLIAQQMAQGVNFSARVAQLWGGTEDKPTRGVAITAVAFTPDGSGQ